MALHPEHTPDWCPYCQLDMAQREAEQWKRRASELLAEPITARLVAAESALSAAEQERDEALKDPDDYDYAPMVPTSVRHMFAVSEERMAELRTAESRLSAAQEALERIAHKIDPGIRRGAAAEIRDIALAALAPEGSGE